MSRAYRARTLRSIRGLQPLSCCGSMSGHTHGCNFVSDRARKAPDHGPEVECRHCMRMAQAATERAETLRARLTANVDAFYADAIGYEAFHAEQRVIWDAIEAEGKRVHEAVLAMLRDGLRVAS